MFRQRFRLALEQLNAGDLPGATQSCAALLRFAANDPAVSQLHATVLLRRGDASAAFEAIRRSLSTRPNHVPSLILAGRAAQELGVWEQAVGFLTQAVAMAPTVAEPAFLLAHVVLAHDADQLAGLLVDLHARFPAEAAQWQGLGLALQRAGRRAAALRAFDAAVAAEPASAKAQFGRGLLLREAGDLPGAEAALVQAVALAPGLAPAWFALGLTYQDRLDEARAAAAYEAALRAQADFAEAAVNLGIARQRLGDMAGALAAYRRAMQVRPESFARIAQAVTTASTGLLWLDLGAFRRSLTADTEDASALLSRP
jgi:tetratricopeptide (TPR) repeat protein